ncbi:MAG: helix-turn-helix domain-containing protein [Cyanobacteriota bacterium]
MSEPSAAAAGLGQRLRQARLDHGLPIEDLAARLHMRPGQIEALEQGATDRWPERAFAIAQVRRLATAMGLDAEALVADLRLVLDQVQTPSVAATAVMRASAGRVARLPTQRQRVFRSSTPSRRPARPQRQWLLLPLLLLGFGAAITALVAALQGRRPPAEVPTAAVPTAVQPRTPRPASAPTLEVSSGEPAWLTVRTVGASTVLFDGTLQGRRSFPLGRQGLELRSGRPDLVLVRQGSAPQRPLGPIDRIAWVAFKP